MLFVLNNLNVLLKNTITSDGIIGTSADSFCRNWIPISTFVASSSEKSFFKDYFRTEINKNKEKKRCQNSKMCLKQIWRVQFLRQYLSSNFTDFF